MAKPPGIPFGDRPIADLREGRVYPTNEFLQFLTRLAAATVDVDTSTTALKIQVASLQDEVIRLRSDR